MSTDLATQIAAAQPEGRRTAYDLVESMRGEFAKALPQHVTIDHFLRLALTELRTSAHLQQCSAESLLGALMTAARVGLEVGGPLGEFYLTPRRIKGAMTVVPIVGYRGLIRLARQAGVGALDARIVRDGDHWQEGADAERGFFFEWTPAADPTRPPVGVLAIARLSGGDVQHRYLTIDEVMARAARGSAGESGPWASDREAMIRKTGIRALAPVLPQSTALATALVADEQVQHYRAGELVPAIEAEQTAEVTA